MPFSKASLRHVLILFKLFTFLVTFVTVRQSR